MADEQQQNLDQKLAGLDDNLQPIKQDDPKDDKPDDKGKEDSKEKPEDKKEEEQTDKADESEEAPEGDAEEDDGYTIDEDEDSDEEEPSNSTQETPPQGQLSPEQQYILDNVQPLTIKGTVGGSDKVQEFKVLAPEQLPSGFKFADDVEMAKANKGFSMLEQRALQLQNDYRTQETEKASKEFKQREDTADRQDIAKLQKEGLIPKFKAQPDSKDFEKDPGVVLTQEVIDFKEKTNQRYMEEYNAGRPYKHIGFEEAFAMYKRDNPKSAAQDKEDKERMDIAKRTSRPAGNDSGKETQKARVHSGMSSRDLDNLIENLDW